MGSCTLPAVESRMATALEMIKTPAAVHFLWRGDHVQDHIRTEIIKEIMNIEKLGSEFPRNEEKENQRNHGIIELVRL